jgi:hypothetical protein
VRDQLIDQVQHHGISTSAFRLREALKAQFAQPGEIDVSACHLEPDQEDSHPHFLRQWRQWGERGFEFFQFSHGLKMAG